MIYFILPVLVFIYSEFVGNIVLNTFKIKTFKFNGLMGFGILMVLFYIISFPLSFLDVPFKTYLIVSLAVLFLLTVFCIINWKKIKFEFDWKDFLFFALLLAIEIIIASNHTVGSLWAFDTVTYTNMLTGTIYGKTINSLDYANGLEKDWTTYLYDFQGYYKFISVALYLYKRVCFKFGTDILYFTQFIWLGSLLLYAYFAEMIVNFIHEFKIKKIYTVVLMLLFLVLFMGNFYWNSEQAYIGNSFRMIMTSYTLFYVQEYFKTHEQRYIWVFILFNLANSSCASSNATLVLILTFVFWCVLEDKKHNFQILMLGCYLPLLNSLLVAVDEEMSMNIVIGAAILLLLLALLEGVIYKLTEIGKLKIIAPVLVFILLFGLSLMVTHDPFDFSAFFDNLSGWSDLTWDYTDWTTLNSAVANSIYVCLMALAIGKYKNNEIIKLIVIATLVFFTPFTAAIQNEYFNVYYRNYDIVINYFTLFLGFRVIDEFAFKLKYLVIAPLICGSLYAGINQVKSADRIFGMKENYNKILKMNNDEADIIYQMKDIYEKLEDQRIEVISPICQLRAEMPNIITLYNRGKEFNEYSDEERLYEIFYPKDEEGDGGFVSSLEDLEEVGPLLKDSDYKYVIVNRKVPYYHDEKEDQYYFMYYTLINAFNSKPIYENDTYAIFEIFH